MQSIINQLSGEVGAVFVSLSLPKEFGSVTRSSRAGEAPFQCNGAMAAAKLAKTPPKELAAQIVDGLQSSPLIKSIEIAGPGFLNIIPADNLVKSQAAELAKDQRTGANTVSDPKKIIIDFGGPNVAKPMHVGHLRSSVIGDALQRLLRFAGHEVISDIHLGDWGLQMGQLITQLQLEQPKLV